MDYTKIIIAILVLITLGGIYFIFRRPSHPSSLATITLQLKDKTYDIEVAKSISERSLGLGNRTQLCPNCGMIFVFGNETILPFWMKNTLIPLDMIWLTKTGKVVDIQTAQTQPGASDLQLKIYKNSLPAQYVLELNAGDAEKLGLKINDTIDLQPLHASN